MLYRVKVNDIGSLWTKTVYVNAKGIPEASQKALARIRREKHGVVSQIASLELVDDGF